MLVDDQVQARNVNGILGLLCKEHYPGLVWPSEDQEPEIPTFDSYALVADDEYRNLADRVIMELWVSLSYNATINSLHSLDIVEINKWIPRVFMQDFFRCQPGQEERAYQVAYASCKRRVSDLYYECRIQAHIDYNATFRSRRIDKKVAKRETEILTREQYLEVNRKQMFLISIQVNYA